MNVVMLGTGYVGLVSGVCLAETGAQVTCIDVDEGKIARLRQGEIPIYEPGLDELVERNTAEGRLVFAVESQEAVAQADIVFIAVGTPSRHGDGHADLDYVYAAASAVVGLLSDYTVVVTKSTVPVGTTRSLAERIAGGNPQAKFDVAANPEFLREGEAIHDFLHPDRVVVGAESERAAGVLKELYRPVLVGGATWHRTGLESAEMIKYASNAFLATKISFINEIAALCDSTGADVLSVAAGMGLDRRIGERYLRPGPGYGGSCFPKDNRALIRIAAEHGTGCRIVEAAAEANRDQKARAVDKIRSAVGGSLAGCCIAVLGLTYKPGTDDLRESPSIDIIAALQEEGATVRAHDPQGLRTAHEVFSTDTILCDDVVMAATGADALVLLTDWPEYLVIDFPQLGRIMADKVLVDLRNAYNPGEIRDYGFTYTCIGRASCIKV